MAAIIWVWFLFIAVSALFAGSLWATIVAELLKERGPKLARASIDAPSVSPSQPVPVSRHGAQVPHFRKVFKKEATVLSPRAGTLQSDASDRLAPRGILQFMRASVNADDRWPAAQSASHPTWHRRSTRLEATGSERPCQSQFANPRKP
jgi:hypothetical protein